MVGGVDGAIVGRVADRGALEKRAFIQQATPF